MRVLAVTLCAFLPLVASAATQEYPEKPIRWVVPWPPGGGVDIATRAMSPALSEALGQNLIVENRPGASGMVGTSFAAKAPADGYTIITAAAGPNAIVPHVNPKVPYDSLKDFASIVHIVNTVYVLVVHPSLPVKNEVVNWYGLLAPAGTPTAVIDKLNKSLNHVLARPDVRERLVAAGLEIVGSTPEEFRMFRHADFEKWGRIVKGANIRFEP